MIVVGLMMSWPLAVRIPMLFENSMTFFAQHGVVSMNANNISIFSDMCLMLASMITRCIVICVPLAYTVVHVLNSPVVSGD